MDAPDAVQPSVVTCAHSVSALSGEPNPMSNVRCPGSSVTVVRSTSNESVPEWYPATSSTVRLRPGDNVRLALASKPSAPVQVGTASAMSST